MPNSIKKHFMLRTALDPRRMPKPKIEPARLQELARRTADWNACQEPKPKT